MAGTWALVISLIVSANTANAQAAAPLVWRAPTECPNAAEVNAHIFRLVAVEEDNAKRKFAATATVSNAAVGNEPWSVVIETSLDNDRGRREFGGATCQAVADATALFVALMLAPGSDLNEQERKPASPPVKRVAAPKESVALKSAAPVALPPATPVPVPKPVVPLELTVSAPEAAPAESRLNVNWHTRLDMGAARGALPTSAPRLGAAIGASVPDRVPWAGLELGLSISLPQSLQPLAAAPWAKVESTEMAGNVAFCLQPLNSSRATVIARVCATAGLQWVRLDSTLVSDPGSNGALMPTIGGGFALGFKITNTIGAVFNARYEHRTRKAAFELPPWGIAWSSPASILHFAAGIEWRL
jgi:hypothetical protein